MDLRLIVITDAQLAAPRDLTSVVREALEAGAPVVQLRDKRATARELYEQALELRRVTRTHDALLIVNDRLDVALAAGADGVHLGAGDLPLGAARHAAASPFIIGYSTDDPETARRVASEGADYIGCGAVFGTSSKAGVDERIGPEGLQRVVRAVEIPVIGIGGIDVNNVDQVAATGAAGVAVIRAVMSADDVAAAVRALLAPFRR